MNSVKNVVLSNWPLRFLAFLLLRPKRLLDEFIYALIDYTNFRRSVSHFRAYLKKKAQRAPIEDRPGLLIVAGHKMNMQFNELWSVLGGVYQLHDYCVYVLSSRSQPLQTKFYRLFGIEPIFLEDLAIEHIGIPHPIQAQFESLDTFSDFKSYELNGIPLGKMALSTFSRSQASGIMDLDNPIEKKQVRDWLYQLYRILIAAQNLYRSRNVAMAFFTEVFMEEYGAFYYAALKGDLNIVRFALTVRDDAVVVQHLDRTNDRTHFSSLSDDSWQRILADIPVADVEGALEQNFIDRYGDRWALSKRNQPNTKIIPVDEARAFIGVPKDRKIAIIYSHILYDTLFFNGEDLFENYADWLVETVKAACDNPNLQWFIKIHPSNLWRGELQQYHRNKYEEIRLLEEHVGQLPDHVKYIYPDTPLSPYTWLQLADYGITVRGTSGIELAALGKPVITAGTGRYEEIGFSINSSTVREYLDYLSHVHMLPSPTGEQVRRGKLFAYATFCMKPFTIDFMKPQPRVGRETVFSYDDLAYLGDFPQKMAELPSSILELVRWSFDRHSTDLLSGWMPRRRN